MRCVLCNSTFSIICQFRLSLSVWFLVKSFILQFWKAFMSPARYYVSLRMYISRPLDILGCNNHSVILASKCANVMTAVRSIKLFLGINCLNIWHYLKFKIYIQLLMKLIFICMSKFERYYYHWLRNNPTILGSSWMFKLWDQYNHIASFIIQVSNFILCIISSKYCIIFLNNFMTKSLQQNGPTPMGASPW